MDAAIRLIGPEWDQGGLHHYTAPCGLDYAAPIMSLSTTIKKFDDMTPQMAAVARHFEMQGRGKRKGWPPGNSGRAVFRGVGDVRRGAMGHSLHRPS